MDPLPPFCCFLELLTQVPSHTYLQHRVGCITDRTSTRLFHHSTENHCTENENVKRLGVTWVHAEYGTYSQPDRPSWVWLWLLCLLHHAMDSHLHLAHYAETWQDGLRNVICLRKITLLLLMVTFFRQRKSMNRSRPCLTYPQRTA